ncbi:MAG: hypothetical protein ACQESA_00460 [Patescibacteria group bacterium]
MKWTVAAMAVATVFFGIIPVAGAQSQNTSADANVESNQIYSPTFEGGESKRNMPGTGLPGFPHTPSYFAKPLMTHEFLSLSKFAEAKLEWTREDINNWSEDSDLIEVKTDGRSTKSTHSPTDKLKVLLQKPKKYDFIGFIMARADEENTSMEAVFSRLASTGLGMGANVLVPINEGAKRVLSASAWGISLGYTQVKIGGGSEQDAGAGAVGFGYAEGESAYRHEPYARVMAISVSPEVYKKLGSSGDRETKLEMENQQLKQQMRQMKRQFHDIQQQQQRSKSK